MLSVELDLTEWTDGSEARGGLDLVLVTPPTDAELLHSAGQTQVIENHSNGSPKEIKGVWCD